MPFALNQICRFASSTFSTPRTAQAPLVTWLITPPVEPSSRYRWFHPSRSDIQITCRPSAMSYRNFLPAPRLPDAWL